MNQEILANLKLAERWKLIGTPDAIAKRFQRLRALPKSLFQTYPQLKVRL